MSQDLEIVEEVPEHLQGTDPEDLSCGQRFLLEITPEKGYLHGSMLYRNGGIGR